jgi:hypothetical protein
MVSIKQVTNMVKAMNLDLVSLDHLSDDFKSKVILELSPWELSKRCVENKVWAGLCEDICNPNNNYFKEWWSENRTEYINSELIGVLEPLGILDFGANFISGIPCRLGLTISSNVSSDSTIMDVLTNHFREIATKIYYPCFETPSVWEIEGSTKMDVMFGKYEGTMSTPIMDFYDIL